MNPTSSITPWESTRPLAASSRPAPARWRRSDRKRGDESPLLCKICTASLSRRLSRALPNQVTHRCHLQTTPRRPRHTLTENLRTRMWLRASRSSSGVYGEHRHKRASVGARCRQRRRAVQERAPECEREPAADVAPGRRPRGSSVRVAHVERASSSRRSGRHTRGGRRAGGMAPHGPTAAARRAQSDVGRRCRRAHANGEVLEFRGNISSGVTEPSLKNPMRGRCSGRRRGRSSRWPPRRDPLRQRTFCNELASRRGVRERSVRGVEPGRSTSVVK